METLDKEIKVKGKEKEMSKVVRTALNMLDNFKEQNNEKNNRIQFSKEYFLRAIDGLAPSRKFRSPSFILNQLVEIWSTLIRVPDTQLKAFGAPKEELIIMSRYLEQVVKDGGFNSIMTQKWGGYKQMGLFGDYFVQMGYKLEGKEIGMPVYRGVSSGDVYTTPTVDFISPYQEGNKATRFGFTISFSRGEIEQNFPGAINKIYPGDLPSLNEWENETSMKDDTQKNKEDYYQVLYFYDTLREVFSIVMGSRAFEYKTFKKDKFPFDVFINRIKKNIIPVAHFGLFASPEGFFYKGLGEVFANVVYSMTELNSGVLNTAIDNSNAPAILNIENSDGGDTMQQIKLAKQRKENTGENTYIIPTAVTDENGRIVNPVGKSNVDYIKNELDYETKQAMKADFDEDIRRFGFNLNTFFNQQDTAKQSELDLEGQNQTIAKFQDQNTDAYKLVYEFAIDAIIKNGNENDKRMFGNDIEIEGEEIGMVLQEAGEPNITRGDVIKSFKKYQDILQLEIDTKSGFVHNPLLERRTLMKLLEFSEPGTPTHSKLLSNLAFLEGGILGGKEPAIPEGGIPELPQATQ